MDELEKLCETIGREGITIDLRRSNGGWQCFLRDSDSRLYSTPNGKGKTAVEAVNAAADQRLLLLLGAG